MYKDKFVFLIDDTDDHIQLITMELQRMGIGRVEHASSAKRAIAHLESLDVAPDLIMVDVEMRPLGGMELLDKLAEIPKCKSSNMKIMSHLDPLDVPYVDFHKDILDFRDRLRVFISANV